MTTIGNLVLCPSIILYFGLLFTMFNKPGSADAAMGYAWLSVLFSVALFVCLAVAGFIISPKGAFGWISPSRAVRILLLTVGLVSGICTTALCGVFIHDKLRMSVAVQCLVAIIPILVPLVLIGSAFVLLNDKWRAAVPTAAYRIPLAAVLLIGLAGMATVVFTYQVEQQREHASRAAKDRIKSINGDDVTASSGVGR